MCVCVCVIPPTIIPVSDWLKRGSLPVFYSDHVNMYGELL